MCGLGRVKPQTRGFMKCFAWIESAVQALTPEGKNEKDGSRRGTPENEKEDIQVTEIDEPARPVQLERTSTGGTLKGVDVTVMEIRNENEGEEISPTIRPISDDIVVSLSKAAKKTKPERESLYDASIMLDYNPAVVAYISDGKVSNPKSLRRRNKSSTSTIFKNSPLAPVTIIVTSPEEEVPETKSSNPFLRIRASRTNSTVSLPASCHNDMSPSGISSSVASSSLLRPPTEQQINAQKLRKAQEFREIRKFLIQFMNAKGDQFPRKLRQRMMEGYSINEVDLAPETVAKFNADINDEGVALESPDSVENTDAEHLRILEMAFRSQIPVLTPTREQQQQAVNPIPPFRAPSLTAKRNRNGSLGVGVGRGIRPKHPLEIAMAKQQEEEEESAPLTWLGPLITTSSSSLIEPPLPSPPPKPEPAHKLTKASSVPNMSRLRHFNRANEVPPVPRIPTEFQSTSYIPPAPEEQKAARRGRNSTVSEGSDRTISALIPGEDKWRIGGKRIGTGLLMGALGGLRGVVGTVRGRGGNGNRRGIEALVSP